MQLYRPRHKISHRTLQRLFLRLHPFTRPRYQTGKSGYNTTCATLKRITAPQHLQRIPEYRCHVRTLYRPAQPPIIIRYIRGCRGAPCCGFMPDCAAYRDHASGGGAAPTVCGSLASAAPGTPAEGSASSPVRGQPGGVSMLSTSGTGSAVRAGHPGTLHPAGQSSDRGRGGRRGTIGGSRRISFRAVAR